MQIQDKAMRILEKKKMLNMTRNDLSEEKKKKYDEIVDEMMKEMDALPRPKGSRLDAGKIKGQKEIEDKYFPQLTELLSE